MTGDSPAPAPGDQATVTVSLSITPEAAFDIFTRDINLWWRRGPRFRNIDGDAGIICIEPKVGGRVFESHKSNTENEAAETVIEIGRTKVWDPPSRLVFEWRLSNFAPHEKTEVEVLFERSRSGTRVTVMHRGWSHIRPDHPARHGLARAEFVRMMGLWWGEQMSSLRVNVAKLKDAQA